MTTITLAIDVQDGFLNDLAKRHAIPRERLVPNEILIYWGYLPADGRPPGFQERLGYSTQHRDPEFRVIPDDLARRIAALVVESLDLIQIEVGVRPNAARLKSPARDILDDPKP